MDMLKNKKVLAAICALMALVSYSAIIIKISIS